MQQSPSMLSRSFVNRLVQSQYVPDNPVEALTLDLSRPIVYILKTKSMTDLVALQRACTDLGLPDPLQAITINDVTIPSYVCLDNPAPLFGAAKPSDEFFDEFQRISQRLAFNFKTYQLSKLRLPALGKAIRCREQQCCK